LGNIVKNNSHYGINLRGGQNNTIQGNFIINNFVGINLFGSLYNVISNNTFNGNEHDIVIYYFILGNYFNDLKSFISLTLILLSIVTFVIVITSLTIELIRKRRLHGGDDKYHLPFYGISALVVESLGALIFTFSFTFITSVVSVFPWLLSLIPFTFVGIFISKKGLKKDAKKFLVGLGLGFGIALLIFSSLLLYSYSFGY